ncbi:MAG TPA: 2-amino-4-hydroxy-6-hydroxymethyldihydropteridine diphosphokinase [Acidiferrobacteraceae bacterium]|nr:2-amino-4-hydroxy-6-hydroxymethyldihydropteridine diphosphokinase [Acidiferrobacteraceae bacterium]
MPVPTSDAGDQFEVKAYIGLGSNLDDPVAQLQRARRSLASLSGTRLLDCSSLYMTAPTGFEDQADFANAVCCVGTNLPAMDLLAELQMIEDRQGRIRDGLRDGPRTLDLDLLLYGLQIISQDKLEIPHPRLHQRAFVLYPLAEIAKNIRVPGLETVSALLDACPPQRIERALSPESWTS